MSPITKVYINLGVIYFMKVLKFREPNPYRIDAPRLVGCLAAPTFPVTKLVHFPPVTLQMYKAYFEN